MYGMWQIKAQGVPGEEVLSRPGSPVVIGVDMSGGREASVAVFMRVLPAGGLEMLSTHDARWRVVRGMRARAARRRGEVVVTRRAADGRRVWTWLQLTPPSGRV